jgi:IS5 family transposase
MQTGTLAGRCQSRGADGPKAEDQGGSGRYARRKCMVEPVFGQIKQARGFRQFLMRGLEKVRGEWALICMTHNLLKFHKICYG